MIFFIVLPIFYSFCHCVFKRIFLFYVNKIKRTNFFLSSVYLTFENPDLHIVLFFLFIYHVYLVDIFVMNVESNCFFFYFINISFYFFTVTNSNSKKKNISTSLQSYIFHGKHIKASFFPSYSWED